MEPLFCPLCGAQARSSQVIFRKIVVRCGWGCPTTLVELANDPTPFEPDREKAAVGARIGPKRRFFGGCVAYFVPDNIRATGAPCLA